MGVGGRRGLRPCRRGPDQRRATDHGGGSGQRDLLPVGSVAPGQFHRRGFHPTGLFATFGATWRRRRSSFLSGGEQQMVAIGRMLMSDPEILLLDEPSDALAPVAVDNVVKALIELRRRGASLLLVEQRVDVAIRLCDRLYIMTHGEIVDEMSPGTVRQEGFGIINKYLG